MVSQAPALAEETGWEEIRSPFSVGATVLVAQLHCGTVCWDSLNLGSVHSCFTNSSSQPGYVTSYLNDRILHSLTGENNSSFSSKFLTFSTYPQAQHGHSLNGNPCSNCDLFSYWNYYYLNDCSSKHTNLSYVLSRSLLLCITALHNNGNSSVMETLDILKSVSMDIIRQYNCSIAISAPTSGFVGFFLIIHGSSYSKRNFEQKPMGLESKNLVEV